MVHDNNEGALKTLLNKNHLLHQCIIEFINVFHKDDALQFEMNEVMKDDDDTYIFTANELELEMLTL